MNPLDLKNLVTSMVVGIAEQNRAESKESDLYKYFIENPNILSQPKAYQHFFVRNQRNVIESALIEIKKIPLDKASEYSSIFHNYQSYKNHVEHLCSKFEGSACSADKSNVLVGRYLKYLIDGNKGTWELDDPQCYWLPRFGTQDQWMKLIHSIWVMGHGNPESYFIAYRDLHDAGIVQLKLGAEEAKDQPQ